MVQLCRTVHAKRCAAAMTVECTILKNNLLRRQRWCICESSAGWFVAWAFRECVSFSRSAFARSIFSNCSIGLVSLYGLQVSTCMWFHPITLLRDFIQSLF